MSKDLDVIEIISDIRELKVQAKALFTLDQRKLIKKLAEREISCSDTVSSDEEPKEKPVKLSLLQKLSGEGMIRWLNKRREKPKEESYEFLNSILSNLNEPNRRLLAMYLKLREAHDGKVEERTSNQSLLEKTAAYVRQGAA